MSTKVKPQTILFEALPLSKCQNPRCSGMGEAIATHRILHKDVETGESGYMMICSKCLTLLERLGHKLEDLKVRHVQALENITSTSLVGMMFEQAHVVDPKLEAKRARVRAKQNEEARLIARARQAQVELRFILAPDEEKTLLAGDSNMKQILWHGYIFNEKGDLIGHA